MNKKRALVSGFVVVLFLVVAVVQMRAQDQADVTETAVRTAVISGPEGTVTAGACRPTGYSAICPSTDGCLCIKIPGAKLRGNLAGVGTADVEITEDQLSATAFNLNGATCIPLFGVAKLTNKRTLAVQDVNILAARCFQFTPRAPDQIRGGFGLGSGPVPSGPTGTTIPGWGIMTGTINRNTGLWVLRLRGPITL
jgi:hypothetical protein